MLFREQVTHTTLLDPPLLMRRAFHGILHPVRRRRLLPALASYFETLLPYRSSGTSVWRRWGGKTVTSSYFITLLLCRSSGTRQHLINQFVTVHFTNRYCESADLSKIEAGCRNMPSDKKQQHKICASTSNSSNSVTSL